MMSELTRHLTEVLAPFGRILLRRMFGCHGVYHEGLMFGLVDDDVLYLKADAQSAGLFEERGLPRFEYLKQGKPLKLSYYMAPEEIYEDEEQALFWASQAYAAALRRRELKDS